MAAFMSDHGFKRKILRIGIPLESLRINGEQIYFGRNAPAVLSATCLAVNVPTFDTADKAKLPCDAGRPVATGSPLGRRQVTRRGSSHASILPTLVSTAFMKLVPCIALAAKMERLFPDPSLEFNGLFPACMIQEKG
jgi:hypothetical protein